MSSINLKIRFFMKKKQTDQLIKKIKIAMLEAGLNQVALAKKMGISSTSVSQWLLGKTRPKYSTLETVGKITGKPVNYFFDNSTDVNGNHNIVRSHVMEEQKTDLEKEILLIKKELEVHRYKLENLELKIEKIQEK